jgi:hypothetical protein
MSVHPAQHDHAGVARRFSDLGQRPHRVVLGDAYRADTDRAGALDQVARRQIGIRAAAIGVQMDVDGEVGSPMVPARRDAHAAVNPDSIR